MSNSNITQRGTQASVLGVMIGRCSLDSQHGRPDRHPANVGYSFFRYTNGDLRNHTNQRPKRKAWTMNDNQLALHCYFRSNPKQLQTHNLPTNDVENINSKNKGRDLLLPNKPWFVPWRIERMLQRIQRHSRITLHRSTHSKWEQNQTEKSSYRLDWLQKRIWYGSA